MADSVCERCGMPSEAHAFEQSGGSIGGVVVGGVVKMGKVDGACDLTRDEVEAIAYARSLEQSAPEVQNG